MVDTVTAKMGLTKPEIGASADSWGNKLNANMDLIDQKVIRNTIQWTMELGDEIPSSSTGYFVVKRFNNAGVEVDQPFVINRQTGDVIVLKNLSAANISTSGNLTVTGTVTAPSLTLSGALSALSAAITNAITAASATLTGAINAATANISGRIGGGSLEVIGASTLHGAVGMNNLNAATITATSVSLVDGFSSNTVTTNAITNNGNSTFSGNTTTAGAATFNGSVVNNLNTAITANGSFASSSFSTFEVRGAYPTITWHYPSVLAMNMSMNSDGHLYIGGGSYGGTYWKIWTTRDFVALPTIPAPPNSVINVRLVGPLTQTGPAGGIVTCPYGHVIQGVAANGGFVQLQSYQMQYQTLDGVWRNIS